jgi:hypothetical protein
MLRVCFSQHPRVPHYLLCSYSLPLINSQQSLHQVLSFLRHLPPVRRVKFNPLLIYFLLELNFIVGIEGRVPTEKDVQDDPNGPPVYLFVVLLPTENFGGHVERSAHERRHEVGLVWDYLGNSKVDQFYHSVL